MGCEPEPRKIAGIECSLESGWKTGSAVTLVNNTGTDLHDVYGYVIWLDNKQGRIMDKHFWANWAQGEKKMVGRLQNDAEVVAVTIKTKQAGRLTGEWKKNWSKPSAATATPK
jgi:hypothetical protein